MAGCCRAARRCRNRSATSSIRSDLIRAFGVDQLRYFLLREVTFGQDGSYSTEAIVNRVNADLANSFGNLAQRTLSFIARNCDGALPPGREGRPGRRRACSRSSAGRAHRAAGAFRGAGAQPGDRGLAEGGLRLQPIYRRPGALDAAQDRSRADERGARDALRGDRDLAIAIQPVIPASAATLLDTLGVPAGERNYAALEDEGSYARLAASGFDSGSRRRRSSRGSGQRARAERDRPSTGRRCVLIACIAACGQRSKAARNAADGRRRPHGDDPPVAEPRRQ